jgi:hypothetical protein
MARENPNTAVVTKIEKTVLETDGKRGNEYRGGSERRLNLMRHSPPVIEETE